MPTENSLSSPIVDLVKAVAWPLFGLVLLLSFWAPLHSIAYKLPDLFRNAKVVRVGSVAIEVQRSAEAPADVRAIVEKLGPDDVKTILLQPYTTGYQWEDSWTVMRWRRLVGFGLATELTPAEGLKKQAELGMTGIPKGSTCFAIGTLFQPTRDYLVDVVVGVLSEANASKKE